MKTPTALSVTSSQREQTSLRFQVPRLPRSNVCSTRDLENPSASVHLKRFSTPSLTLKFLCAGKLNPRSILDWTHCPVSELPPEDGNIALMGRKPIKTQTPDLFSSQAGASPNEAAEASRRLSRQPALPKDLPRAIRHLADIELDWLLRVASQEAKRRGRPLPTDAVGPTKTDTAATPRERQTRQEKIGQAAALTRGQMNAVPSRVQGRCAATPN
jgi:hypothetical protein